MWDVSVTGNVLEQNGRGVFVSGLALVEQNLLRRNNGWAVNVDASYEGGIPAVRGNTLEMQEGVVHRGIRLSIADAESELDGGNLSIAGEAILPWVSVKRRRIELQ